MRTRVHLSWGSVPYSARQNQASCISQRFHPPAPTVLRVSHPLDDLLRPKPWKAYFIPPALLGFSLTSTPRRTFRFGRGDAPELPLHGLLLLHDEHVLACSPVLRFVALSRRTLSRHDAVKRRTLHGLDHRRIGVSQGSEPGAPTILRFSADFTLVDSERLLGPWVSPQLSGSVAAPHPASSELFASPPFTAPRACVSASDPTTNRVVE